MINNFQYWNRAKTITPRRRYDVTQQHKSHAAGDVQTHTDFNTSAFAKSHVASHKHIHSRFRSCATDQQRRAAFERRELYRRVYKGSVIINCVTPRGGTANFGRMQNVQMNRCVSMKKVSAKAWVKNGTLGVVRNRCVVSGMNTVISKLGLSRICFRRLAGAGSIPGLVKI